MIDESRDSKNTGSTANEKHLDFTNQREDMRRILQGCRWNSTVRSILHTSQGQIPVKLLLLYRGSGTRIVEGWRRFNSAHVKRGPPQMRRIIISNAPCPLQTLIRRANKGPRSEISLRESEETMATALALLRLVASCRARGMAVF